MKVKVLFLLFCLAACGQHETSTLNQDDSGSLANVKWGETDMVSFSAGDPKGIGTYTVLTFAKVGTAYQASLLTTVTKKEGAMLTTETTQRPLGKFNCFNNSEFTVATCISHESLSNSGLLGVDIEKKRTGKYDVFLNKANRAKVEKEILVKNAALAILVPQFRAK